MRKLLFLLFPAFVVLSVLNCSDESDKMPCATCNESYPRLPDSYAYCLYYSGGSYRCSYMSVSDCYYENGNTYSNSTCGGSAYVPPSSSSSRPSSSSSEYTGGSCNVSDYGTVTINGQIWMAKNWGCYVSGSKCYNNDPANCTKYGRLYDWSTAMGISSSYNSNSYNPSSSTKYRGVCPSGWHIPNGDEWNTLMNSVGGSSTAGKHLKAKEGWYNCGPSGSGKDYLCEDTYEFAALPGGYGYSVGNFGNVGYYGNWWSASEYNAYYAYYRSMLYYEGAYYNYNNKSYLFSVRCLQD
jgi:uncharacterized protein (TIGR02145 family)